MAFLDKIYCLVFIIIFLKIHGDLCFLAYVHWSPKFRGTVIRVIRKRMREKTCSDLFRMKMIKGKVATRGLLPRA